MESNNIQMVSTDTDDATNNNIEGIVCLSFNLTFLLYNQLAQLLSQIFKLQNGQVKSRTLYVFSTSISITVIFLRYSTVL